MQPKDKIDKMILIIAVLLTITILILVISICFFVGCLLSWYKFYLLSIAFFICAIYGVYELKNIIKSLK
jgi:hypothetical protein